MPEKPEDQDNKISQTKLKIDAIFKKLILSTDKINPLVASLRSGLEDLLAFKDDIERITEVTFRYYKLIQKSYLQLDKLIKNKIVSEALIKDIRHNIRSPIEALLGYSDLLQQGLLKSENDQDVKYMQIVSMIIFEANAAVPIIDSLRLDELEGNDDYPLPNQTGNVGPTLHEALREYNPQYAGLTVLIIDDSPYSREILSRHLSRYGVQVITAGNGVEGLKIVQSQSVDLILLDIMMPVMGGYETLSHLKSDEQTEHIPVLMLSAFSEVESIVHCIEAGAADYLPIPFNSVILHARVKACLDRKLLYDREQSYLEQLEQLAITV